MSWWRQATFQWDDDDVRFVLDHDAYSCVFIVLTHWNNWPHACQVWEATNINLIVFGLIRSTLISTIFPIHDGHHYKTDAVLLVVISVIYVYTIMVSWKPSFQSDHYDILESNLISWCLGIYSRFSLVFDCLISFVSVFLDVAILYFITKFILSYSICPY